ncbi:MAG TPA: hypothetical protein VGL55_02420 [Steroidobacteraceae bacterium]|jgi:hypothetical protein
MRLSSSPDASRQERTERLRRQRAAARALRVAFPAIQQLRLELTFDSGTTNAPVPQSHILHPAAQAFFEFPCPYADCDGKYDLTAAVDTALANKTGKARGSLECPGHRPEHYNSRRPCKLRLSYAITATYQSGG